MIIQLQKKSRVSKLDFRFNKWMHLMHIASYPHKPHGQSSNYYCDQSNSIQNYVYFLFSDYLPKGDDRPTYEMIQPPTTRARISQTIDPITRGPIDEILLSKLILTFDQINISKKSHKQLFDLLIDREDSVDSNSNRLIFAEQPSILFFKKTCQNTKCLVKQLLTKKPSINSVSTINMNIFKNYMQALQIQSSKTNPSQPQAKKITHEAIFFIHGITSLIGWFVILNSLDYFHSIYTKYDVYEFFLLSILIGYVTTAATYRKITEKFTVQRIINIGLIVCTGALLLLLLTPLIFKNAQAFGFLLSVILCIIVGISSNIVQLSYFSMINFVPQKAISRFTIGTAFSGLSLTIIRMIITAITGTAPRLVPILVYFLIACGVQIIDLFLNNIFCRSQYFFDKLAPYMNKNRQTRKILNLGEQNTSVLPQIQQQSFFKQLLEINKAIYPYPAIIFSNFVITMMLFPDLTIKIKFNFSKVWSSLIFLLLFALGDTIGKFLVEIKNSFNKKSIFYLIFARLTFFLIIPVLASGKVINDPLVSNNFFPFLVLYLFGLSGGFIVSSSVILVSQKCKTSQKELSGVLCGISIQLGLICGTILAFPMQFIAAKQNMF